ncbi:hypothetical protein, partial [Klebsiella aerogenes]|uniref:hypothetical protein n=1 Tax=Klebsiella aerogenes TaxID=548 RepID=UPI001BCF4695
LLSFFFFLWPRPPPSSTHFLSSAAAELVKEQDLTRSHMDYDFRGPGMEKAANRRPSESDFQIQKTPLAQGFRFHF